MTTATEYYNQAELALAAYADLTLGNIDPQKLRDADMSEAQSVRFAQNWSVLAQFPDAANQTNSGVSATLFKNKLTGEISLAIRGTEPSLTDINYQRYRSRFLFNELR